MDKATGCNLEFLTRYVHLNITPTPNKEDQKYNVEIFYTFVFMIYEIGLPCIQQAFQQWSAPACVGS